MKASRETDLEPVLNRAIGRSEIPQGTAWNVILKHITSTEGPHTRGVSVYVRNIKKCMGEY